MTTNRPLPSAALTQAARALRWAQVLQGLLRWGVFSAAAILVLIILDDLLHLPTALRLPLAVVLAGGMVFNFYRRVLRPAFRPLSAARAARLLEIERGIRGNLLINSYQFENERTRADRKDYVEPLLASSSSVLGAIPSRSLWLTSRLKRWIALLAVLVVAWAFMVVVYPRSVATGIERIFLPLADIPPAGSWDISVTPAREISLVEGDRLDLKVRLQSTSGSKAKPPLPILVWQEGTDESEANANAGEHASLLPTANPNEFTFSFSAVSQPFSFRVWADDSRSAAVIVNILPLPQWKTSTFAVTPPAYTGLKPYSQPGPPAALEVPSGSSVQATVALQPDTSQLSWREGKQVDPWQRSGDSWQFTRFVHDTVNYDVLVSVPGQTQPRLLGQGQITAIPDHPPDVDFLTQDRNRAVNPGGEIPVTISATDDYGVASISLLISPGDDPTTTHILKTWTLLGPPGQKEPPPQNYSVPLDPAVFIPGSTFLLTAQATDFSPDGQKGTSRPILLRVAGLQDMAVPSGDVLEKLFGLLRDTITAQTRANSLTDNLALHLAEALAAKDTPQHFAGMSDAQHQAQDTGSSALDEATHHDEAKVYQTRLQALIKGEMPLALGQIGAASKLPNSPALSTPLSALQDRQAYILNELISLLGRMATERQAASELKAKKPGDSIPPIAVAEELNKLKDELKNFGDQQKRIINASRAYQELNPEDLTTDQQAVLGELAREEAKQAAYFQEKLTDLSKLPLQDFADGKLVQDMNEVYQEVQAAATALYAKRMEIAVPSENMGYEKAAEIEQNLERWLPSAADNTKWSIEEPPQGPADIPMAELPKQLDDLIGDLLHEEQEMDHDKDDVTSSTMDSIDKGAGWGALDGPTSNMSAKGVTGNQLPNNDEISGRSGEGRNGKSDGQMVGDNAVGKGGAETPTRMTPTPFENGSVNSTARDSKGGATGGGKVAGFGQRGLLGPMAPPSQRRFRVLAQQQAQLLQQAESLALQLQKQRRPTGDLESAIHSMQQLENAANHQDGLAIVQGYHQALDALQAARTAYAGERLSRVESDQLTRDPRQDLHDTQADEAPAGYEEMTGAYFRSLSESASSVPSSSP